MYHHLTKIFTMLFLLTAVSFSANAKKDVMKVYDKGQDGGNRIYSVACPNGKKTTVTQPINISYEYIDTQELNPSALNAEADASVKLTAQTLKDKALRLIGQQNRAERCIYPTNSKKQCKSYKDVDTAAKAACDLLR
ncbi:MAG: hypothetical protein CMF53_05445 [Legionellales bacterium]|jgi:hypothetical protein|nr:hypothetical protein [Legionellales bacterium]HBH10436.1 hypothetical protein [Gammaproteobacteria bacterium]|tara:strand:- start:264 stop:674 length:411 start_codon:yes stop_codon:yes gene_type:complete